MKRLVVAAALLTLPLEGFAQEVILTPEPAERKASGYDKRKEMGDWARGVIERAASGEAPEDDDDPDVRPCAPPPDREPHGVVWGTVGTGGYTSVGMVVTQPIGDCGSLTLGVSRSEGGRGPRRRP